MGDSAPGRRTGGYAPLSLRTNFQWTFASNIVFSVTQWLVLIFIARLGSQELVGQFALGLAVSAPIFMFTNMELRAVFTTDRNSSYPFWAYLGVRIGTAVVSIPAVWGVFALLSFDDAALGIVLLVAVSKAIQAIGDIFHGVFQKHERMDIMSFSRVAQGTLGVLSLSGAMLFSGSLAWGLAALSVSWLAVVVLFDAPLAWRVHRDRDAGAEFDRIPTSRRYDRSAWWSSARGIVVLAIPLGITAGVASINENIPRYLVEIQLGIDKLGVFASTAYLMRLLGVFGTAVSAAALPRLAQFYSDGERTLFVSLIARLASIAAVIGLAGLVTAALIGDHILVLAYGPDYREQAVFVAVMAAAGASIVTSFLSQGLIAAQRFRDSLVVQSFVALSTFGASLVLIPTLDLVGAGLSLLVGFVVGALLTWWYLRKAISRLGA